MTNKGISREEAVQFLRRNLHLSDEDISHKTNRFDLLEKIVRAFHRCIPYQNITFLATPPEQRCVLTEDEIKEDMFSGKGGVCLTLNVFLCDVLLALNYDAYLAGGRIEEPFVNIRHASVIVQNLKHSGDIYLLDVGLAMPTFRAIPLDFVDESPVFSESFQWYKYTRTPGPGMEDDYARRFAEKTSEPFCTEEDFSTICKFTLERVSFDTLRQLVDKNVYKNSEWRYGKQFLVMHWPQGRAVAMLSDKLKKEDESGQLKTVRQMESEEEWVSTILEEFPMMDRSTVERAVKWCLL